MRPIDADRLKGSIKKLEAKSPDIKTARIIDRIIQEIFPQIVDDEPTADVEPVEHGRWIRAEAKGYPVKRSSIWYCSECGEKIKYNDTLGRYQKTKKTVSQVNPRCRKCGAKMDGGAN